MKKKRFCTVFNCDKKHESCCCFYCDDRAKCPYPCRNHPEKCGLLKPTITFEEFMGYILPELTSEGKRIRRSVLEQVARELVAKEIVVKGETGEIAFHSEKLPLHYRSIYNGRYKLIRIIESICRRKSEFP